MIASKHPKNYYKVRWGLSEIDLPICPSKVFDKMITISGMKASRGWKETKTAEIAFKIRGFLAKIGHAALTEKREIWPLVRRYEKQQ